MLRIERLYELLQTGQTPDCERIIEAGLEHSEPEWFERQCGVLLERGSDAAWGVLIGSYRRLSVETRRAVHEDLRGFQHGLALAARKPQAAARLNAMIALEVTPLPGLMYLASAALRDPDRRVRSVAGRALLKAARNVMSVLKRPPEHLTPEQLRAMQRDMARAAEEALRGFDTHQRSDVLRACLWFAREIEGTLWSRLAVVRSRMGLVLHEHLDEWADADVAWFLVSALGKPAWRSAAARVLRSWSGQQELLALLRISDLLNEEHLIDHFAAVYSPRWFAETDPGLREIPGHLRPRAPWWVYRAGYTEEEKLAYLSHWARSDDPALQEAAIEALLRMRGPEAQQVLRAVPSGPPHVSARIREALSGSPAARAMRHSPPRMLPLVFTPEPREAHEAEASARLAASEAPESVNLQRPTSATRAESATTDMPDDSSSEVEGRLVDLAREASQAIYLQLRDAAVAADDLSRQSLIELLRTNTGAWNHELRTDLNASDARRRLLAMQVVGTAQLGACFREELDRLRGDAAMNIRLLADGLCAQLDALAAGGLEASAPPRRRLRHDDLDALEELDEALTRLVSGDDGVLPRVEELVTSLYREFRAGGVGISTEDAPLDEPAPAEIAS